MIQELLGVSSGNFIPTLDSKISLNAPSGGILPPPIPSSTTTTTVVVAAAAAAATATSSNSENQNLRCPRCDSSNTKFCYYNNYNLTQPRHFCKTCRRYWTKGGALRNVPIGGGCRKNKTLGSVMSSSSTSLAKPSTSAAAKIKTVSSSSLSSGLGGGGGGSGGGFDHHHHHQEVPAASPILWGSPQNSQLLAFLTASHSQNPSPSLTNNNAVVVGTEPMGSNGLRSPGFDLTGSFWRSNIHQDQLHQQQNMGFVQNSGIQELYHRLRSSSSSANNYCSGDDSSTMFLGNMASSSSSSSSLAILESGPVVLGGGLGYWNQPLSSTWSDLPTTNGASAYP